MPAHFTTPQLLEAYITLREAGSRGLQLANVLDRRGTTVRVAAAVSGGFTLNFINTILLQPLRADASDFDFKIWVTLLGHEACHIEQGFWVDSVQQEIRSYIAQGMIGDELGIDTGFIKDAFGKLNPDSPDAVRLAQAAMLTLFAGQPAALVYASLPLLQPRGLGAFVSALRQLAAVVRAGSKPRTA